MNECIDAEERSKEIDPPHRNKTKRKKEIEENLKRIAWLAIALMYRQTNDVELATRCLFDPCQW
jgi:hypothetical protein